MENGDQPATKADLQNVQEQLRSEIRESAEQLRSEFQHGFDDLKEAMRDVQTELLNAFCNVTQSNHERL